MTGSRRSPNGPTPTRLAICTHASWRPSCARSLTRRWSPMPQRIRLRQSPPCCAPRSPRWQPACPYQRQGEADDRKPSRGYRFRSGPEWTDAGVRPVVLERLPAPSDEPKANGMVGQVIRQLDMRGLYRRFTGSDDPPKPMYEWIFSGMPVRFFGMADNPMYALMMHKPRLVRLLSERAHELGVDVRWGHELIGVKTRSDGVAVRVSAAECTYVLDTPYLVGADGGPSTVRKMAGIDFAGYTSNTVARLAHVSLPDEMRTENGGIDVPGFGRLPFGHNRLDQGGIISAEFERDRQLLGP